MDFVCIDRLEGGGLTAQTVAVWCDGHFEDNVSYALQDTPCGDVVGKTICCFPASVCQFFPRDQVLQDLRAESYIGVTLWSHTGQPVGLIAVIGRRPLANRSLAEATLKIVAARAAGELERLDTEQALRESEGRIRAKLDAILMPEGDIGALELADFFDVPAIQHIMDDFYSLTQMGVALLDLRGKVLVATGWQDICTKFHRVHPETAEHCKESDLWLSEGVAPGTCKSYQCKNHLRDIVTPITVGGKHVGNLFLGQFRFEDETLDYGLFREQARRYGFNETEYIAAYERVPRWSKDNVDAVMRFYMKLAEMIAQLSYSNIKIARTLTEHERMEKEKEKLEAQLRQAQKMEAVGQLAGGVAHDFNNLLQVILGYVDLLHVDLHKNAEHNESLDAIHQAAERAADLTRQLLAFSRHQIIQPVNLDLNDLVHGVLKMIRRLIGENIELHYVPGDRLGTVYVDKGQIEQILMNLCVNARDAMPTGGMLTIETENVVIGDDYCRDHPWATEGRYVLLSVTDTGHGMDEPTRDQIFEPFFTTKGLGEGTGLGLATVYGIVKQHKGLIHVYSEVGKGTAFKIYIPSVERPAEEVGTKVKVRAIGGSETILVAEDDDDVRSLLVRILKEAGYTVWAARDGEEALRCFDEHADAIHMALLDVMMPKVGGQEVMMRIQARSPRMRFLFSSGYSENALHVDFVIREGLRLITKPHHKDDLLRAIRATLDPPQP